ncbi:MAG: HAD family hydrolase [Oscillospiraceae bacterium]|jgi:Cof subfamily protein (haloacid dehalogenase superfamily)|nr:HAD family hydrolase [Oscillospiraceae bacterium]
MEKTLYISDLDGTLLRNNAALSPYTVDVLRRKIAGGLRFSYATARSRASVVNVTGGFMPDLPIITNNGVFICDLKTDKRLHGCYMDKEKVLPLHRAIRENNIPVFVYAFIDGRERVSWIRGTENAGMRAYLRDRHGDQRLRPVDDWGPLFDGDIFYHTIIEERDKASHLLNLCNQTAYCRYSLIQDTYNTDEWWLEIFRHDASKAAALLKLKSMLGFDRVVAFGDNLNDISMFECSDACYAVANAHPALRKIATGVIGSNEEDGVANWLLEHA